MEAIDFTAFTDDELDRFITGIETRIGAWRTHQMGALREVDRRQTPLADGCRSLGEWVTGRLDVAPDTAKTLVATAKRLEELPVVEETAAAGELSFDRTAAVARLAEAGADDEEQVLSAAAVLDVAGIRRHAAHRRRITRDQEQRAFRDRYVATQSNLDHTMLDFHGRLSGVAGRVFEAALHTVGDALPDAPGVTRSRATRNADALWRISQDALDGNHHTTAASTPLVTVFVDAAEAAATGGETGLTVESGPRVGPNLLEALACHSQIEVTAVTDGIPLNLGRRSRTITPQLRRYVLHRDGGVCTAAGCVSRYRLEAHHIIPWSHNGHTDANNLTTLCWYHHHVVIHGEGHSIDPNSPPCRRRFKPPRNHDPP